MQRRGLSIRALLCAFASLLLVKAAVPLLAAGAAHLQGVPVGSICGIYGVTLPSAEAGPHANPHAHHGHHGHEPASDGAPSHAGADREHCALSGLAAMAVPALAAPPLALARAVAPEPRRTERICAGDACAAWAARMQHPPPIQA
jgi:hypothetical protein